MLEIIICQALRMMIYKRYLKKNWVKYLIIITLFIIFLFPDFVGDLFGAWFNKLAISFIKNITF